jgi:hypothetical protein
MIDIVAPILMGVGVFGIIMCFYFLYRNNKVYEFRTGLIWNDYDAYLKLPPYNKMLWSFKKLNKENWVKEMKIIK